MRFKIPTKYPLEIASVGYWTLLMVIFLFQRVYIQQLPITITSIIDGMKIATIFALGYYVIFLRRELKRLKSK